MPPGPLGEKVRQINLNQLSEFKPRSSFDQYQDHCQYALLRHPKTQHRSIKEPSYFMTEYDVPDVLSYLIENDYIINTDLTELVYKTKIASIQPDGTRRNLICIFTG